MLAFKTTSLVSLITALLFASSISASPVLKASGNEARQTSSYWLANIKRQGTTNYAPQGYKLYRNVLDYGADPSGKTDSTAAINKAISDGNRCGQGCDSTTSTPALVYVPAGKYLIKSSIIQYYYTQLIGDAANPPTLVASSDFTGMAVIDANPYNGELPIYTNQNNFYRQIRNFRIDLTATSAGTGIHWEVAQATSLQNIYFDMSPGSKQQGIFMENGSGGFVSNLTFTGGKFGAVLGSQQFTSRNLVFNNVDTAISLLWNWGWTFHDIQVNGGNLAIDMSNSPTNQTVGSVVLMDSKISSHAGVKTAWTTNSIPNGGGSLVLDNVDFSGCGSAVTSATDGAILAGNKLVKSFVQGRYYNSNNGQRIQKENAASVSKSANLLSNGKFFARDKPQYQNVDVNKFVSIRTFGAVGDGNADDTAAFAKAFSSIGTDKILYIDHGAYKLTDTVNLPANVKVVGEHWPVIQANGAKFSDQNNPRPLWQVGQAGQSGAVELQDLVFSTQGPAPGAVLLRWNLNSAQGASGVWDVHFRVGGAAGTKLQAGLCSKNPKIPYLSRGSDYWNNCLGAFLLFHAAPSSGGVYVDNSWMWVADHELDLASHDQLDIYNGRGLLIESKQGPSWYWGTAVEHSTLYNYQINRAQDVFLGFIQSETPYMQSNPGAKTPYYPQLDRWADPTFTICANNDATCQKSWGLRIQGGKNVFIYGAGLYSFFDNYDQTCVNSNNCQKHMVSVQSASQNVWLFALSTKAAVNMLTLNGSPAVKDSDNRSNFCATIAGWTF